MAAVVRCAKFVDSYPKLLISPEFDFVVNAAGRRIPKVIPGYGPTRPFMGSFACGPSSAGGCPVVQRFAAPATSKLCASLAEALRRCGLCDGMTISFHHHLREGDNVVNQTMAAVQSLGVKDLTLAPTAFFNVHEALLPLIRSGVITRVEGSMNGAIGRFVSEGGMRNTCVLRSHGGRVRTIHEGLLKIDIAVVAAPVADAFGNANGLFGVNACGCLAYSKADSLFAKKVIVVTDNLVPYPCSPIEIAQTHVDYVTVVDSIGDAAKIVSGTTRIADTGQALAMARNASQLAYESGYLKNGCTLQAGAGGSSLSSMKFMGDIMAEKGIRGSWVNGGTTEICVDMLHRGLVESLITVQAFDISAVESLRKDKSHCVMDMDAYANPFNAGCVVNQLDVVVLGATEVDVDFNVNVNTHSDGYLLHGIGGHQDTAAGAKLCIITCPTARGANPIVLERVHTVTTPGECVDAIVTEEGIAINPRRVDLLEKLKGSALPLRSIEELRKLGLSKSGRSVPPPSPAVKDRIVAVIEWRDGTVLDVVREVAERKKAK